MSKSSFVLHPNTYFDQSHNTVAKGQQEGIRTFDGVWSRRSENIYKIYDLSLIVSYLQLGLLGVEFPRTSRSGPSDLVLVVPIPRTIEIERFTVKNKVPYPVNWRVWQNVVIPVLSDTTLSGSKALLAVRNGLTSTQSIYQSFDYHLRRVEGSLRKVAQEGGYIVPPNEGENTASYLGLYDANSIPEETCCCPEET